MARPSKTSGQKRKKLFHDFSGKELWTRLESGMKRSGMLKQIMLNPELKQMLEQYETQVNADSPSLYNKDKAQFMYESRVPVVRHLLKEDNNWMIRWVSNPDRLAHVNIVKEEFLKYGPSALPAHYKHAEKFGGIFRWTENARKTIILMLRGLGKSHNDVIVRAIHNFVRNPAEKSLIGHSADDKAEDNLKRIRDALFHPNLQIAFPEFFVDDVDLYRARGVEIRKERINMRVLDFDDMYRIIDPSDYMRGEWTWNLFTPRVDVTGQHYDRITLDDFATEDNTRTKERADKIAEVFRALTFLEEYKIDEKTGNMVGGKLPFMIVNTQKFIPNFITDILDNDDDVSAFVMPMTWDPDEHKTIYSYCKEHKYRIDPMITDEFIDAKKTDCRTEEKFKYECYMIGADREMTIKLSNDQREFTFCYKDERGPNDIERINMDYDELHRNYPIIISKDPSYSSKNKSIGDGQSNDVVLRCVFRDGVYYFTGSYSETGNLSLEGQKRGIITLTQQDYPDFVTIDSHGTQIFVTEQIFGSLKDMEYKDLTYINYIPYTKMKESSTPGKAQTIQAVLSAMFQAGAVRVHWKLGNVIAQIMRDNIGFDFLDAMVQVMSISVDELRGAEFMKKLRIDSMRRKKSNLQKNVKRRTIFKTTGY